MPAARAYQAASIPYFTPGCSDDGLAIDQEKPVFQVFPRDSEQAVCLVDAALLCRKKVVIAYEELNYGKKLYGMVSKELMLRKIPSDTVNEWGEWKCAEPVVVLILGSREYSKKAKLGFDLSPNDSCIMSDDSFEAKSLMPGYVRSNDSVCFPQFSSRARCQEIYNKIKTISKKSGGPYIWSSYLAARLALQCLKLGARTPAECLKILRERQWESVHGNISFGPTGKAYGMEWCIHEI